MVNKTYYSKMSFKKFYKIMNKIGLYSQMDIANYVQVSQGSISQWKSKNKIPLYIAINIGDVDEKKQTLH